MIFDAGVDVAEEDSLGGFNVSHEGLYARDYRTISFFAHEHRIPTACVIGGGYDKNCVQNLARRHSRSAQRKVPLHRSRRGSTWAS